MSRPASDLQMIFARALERESPAERARYLVEACDDDAALRGEVESLLRAFAGTGTLPETPLFSTASVPESRWAGDGPGSVIGPYKLLEPIGEGGMGVVYMAEQTNPIRRKVAVKIIKPGMDSRQVIARFEAERQALALMDHPNIAKVFDAGATGDGPAVLRHGAGQGRSDHGVLRPGPPDSPRATRAARAGLPGDPARASEGDHPPRHQAVERPGLALRRHSRCPR